MYALHIDHCCPSLPTPMQSTCLSVAQGWAPGPKGSLSTVAPLQAVAQAIKPGGSSSLGGKEAPRSMQVLQPSVQAAIGKYACNCMAFCHNAGVLPQLQPKYHAQFSVIAVRYS